MTKLELQPLYFWVDFICIEQNNDEEKQLQLFLMPQIYQRALRVIAWLGPSTVESDTAIHCLISIISTMKNVDASLQLSEVEEQIYKHLLALVQLDNDGATNFFERIWNLLNRDYFGRVWTVQEAASAQDRCVVLCGDQSFKYSILVDLTSRFFEAKNSDSHWIQVKDALRPRTVISDPENPFRPVLAHPKAVWRMQSALCTPSPDNQAAVKFLNDLRALECVDPRDRIFTTVPFLSQSLINAIRETSPLTTEELYTLFAITELNAKESIDCLAVAGLCYNRQSYPDKYPIGSTTPYLAIPSWVPDWTCPKTNESLWSIINRVLECNGKHLYEASGQIKPDVSIIRFRIHPIAVVKGVIVDTVLDASDRYRIEIWPIDPTAEEALDLARHRSSFMMVQVNNCVSLALKHLSPNSDTEKTRIVHQVRKALVSDVLPIAFNGPEGLLDRARPEEIDGMFQRAQADLEHWDKVHEEKLNGALPRVLSQEEQEAQEQEDTEWKRIFCSSPNLMICLATTFKGRRFFVTENHRCGIGPSILLPGDKICVFFGGDTPFVIRPVKKSSETSEADDTGNDRREQDENEADVQYQLVGECYVNDLMDGEAMKIENVHAQSIYLV